MFRIPQSEQRSDMIAMQRKLAEFDDHPGLSSRQHVHPFQIVSQGDQFPFTRSRFQAA